MSLFEFKKQWREKEKQEKERRRAKEGEEGRRT